MSDNDFFSDSDGGDDEVMGSAVHRKLDSDVGSELGSELGSEVVSEVRSKVTSEVGNEVDVEVERQERSKSKSKRSTEDVRREYMKYKKLGEEVINSEMKSRSSRGSSRGSKEDVRRNVLRDYMKVGKRGKHGKHGKDKKPKDSNPYRERKIYSEVNSYFQEAFKSTSSTGDSDAFKYLLRKSPIPVVLHHLHFLFYVNRDNSTKMRILLSYNNKFNVVSRYFLKAMKTESRASSAMKSMEDVSKQISTKTPLETIDNLLHFTPEFILLKTIQAGDMESHDKIVSEWELVDGFKRSCDLIAAFFGVRRFFSDTSRYTDSQAVIIACICGGSVETLSKIVKNTDTKWLSDFTMRKTREMCTPPEVMLQFLRESYGLKM